MSFNFSHLTHVSILTLSASALSLSVLSGCSSNLNDSIQTSSQKSAASAVATRNEAAFDSYYGMPKAANSSD